MLIITSAGVCIPHPKKNNNKLSLRGMGMCLAGNQTAVHAVGSSCMLLEPHAV